MDGSRGRFRGAVSVVVAPLVCLVSSCAATPSPPAPAASSPGPAGTSSPGPGSLVVSPSQGWSSAGLSGPVPAPGACRYQRAEDGQPLPDPSCTPGAVDGSITQADLATTICRPGGYSESVRPPEAETEPYKYADMRAYGATGSPAGYELDHLVPLEVGGSSDTRNLWPEPDDHPSPGVANSKDPVEDDLHDLVCNAVEGKPYVPLATAQELIATNWTTAAAKAADSLVQP